jgi:hypothetical protein
MGLFVFLSASEKQVCTAGNIGLKGRIASPEKAYQDVLLICGCDRSLTTRRYMMFLAD